MHGNSLYSALRHGDFWTQNFKGSVAIHLRCGGIFNHCFTLNLLLSLQVKEFWKLVIAFSKTRVTPFFLDTVCRLEFLAEYLISKMFKDRIGSRVKSLDQFPSLQYYVTGLMPCRLAVFIWYKRQNVYAEKFIASRASVVATLIYSTRSNRNYSPKDLQHWRKNDGRHSTVTWRRHI